VAGISLHCLFFVDSRVPCGRFKHVLGSVLAIGNYLNGGTNRGQAYGFKLELLPKLQTLKAGSAAGIPNYTLVNFLVDELERTAPRHLKFYDSWINVRAAATISIKNLVTDIRICQNDFRKITRELEAMSKMPSTPVRTAFERKMEPYVRQTTAIIDEIEATHQRVTQQLEAMLQAYGEAPKKGDDDAPIAFFQTVINFADSVK
jgi:hypothetical protein